MNGLHSSSEERSQFRVPPDSRIPYRQHAEAAELWREELRRQARTSLAGRHDAMQALDRTQRALHGLLDGEGRHRLDLLRREILERQASSSPTPMGEDVSRSEIDRIREALHGQGVDTNAIRKAIGEFRHHVQDHDLRHDLVTPLDWDRLHEIYHRPDPALRNPWVTFRPPYWGWQTGHNTGAVADFTVGHQHLLDANTGHVGSIITLDCPDASDLSVGSRETHTQVAFWYRAPVTGLVEINVTAICGEARHQLRVVDEWGVSDASVSQICQIMAHVLHAGVRGPSFRTASQFHFQGDNSAHRDVQNVRPGQTVFVPLVSDGPVAAGDWMVIRAGVRCMSGAITNDMEIYSRCTMSWFLSRIDVHIRE